MSAGGHELCARTGSSVSSSSSSVLARSSDLMRSGIAL
jgi:hypothetical protein